jgi:hypothetical protein
MSERPFILWKCAASLDGRIAAADGSSSGSPRPRRVPMVAFLDFSDITGNVTERFLDPSLRSEEIDLALFLREFSME